MVLVRINTLLSIKGAEFVAFFLAVWRRGDFRMITLFNTIVDSIWIQFKHFLCRGSGGSVNVLKISGPRGFPDCGTTRVRPIDAVEYNRGVFIVY